MLLAPGLVYENVETWRDEYAHAVPFPHIVIDGALTVPPAELADAFPGPHWDGWGRYPDEYQRGKMICSDVERIPHPLRELIDELSAPRFLGFLETVSGVRGLVTDPYLEGGGLHCSGPGGALAPHTDFHLYGRLSLYRRLNVLLYLNETWDEHWGGCLKLYGGGGRGGGGSGAAAVTGPAGAGPAVRTVVPAWGTMVVFTTDARSLHGFPDPIAPERWRRSLALYYYTAAEAPGYAGDHNTYWVDEGPVSGTLARRARVMAYRGLLFGSRALGFAAHRVDPRLPRAGRPDRR